LSRADFKAARDKLLAAARADTTLTNVRTNSLEDTPALSVDIDQEKVGALGLAQRDVDATLSTAWGGNYVNDFIDRGRVKRVYVQGDAQFAAGPRISAAGTCAPRTARWRPSPLSPPPRGINRR